MSDDYVPFSRTEPEEQVHLARLSTKEPVELWLIATSPAMQLMLGIGLGALDQLTFAAFAAMTILASIGCFLLARRDEQKMKQRGYPHLASPPLALIAPAYLAVRGWRKFDRTQTGLKPLWLHLALLVVLLWFYVWGGVAFRLLELQH